MRNLGFIYSLNTNAEILKTLSTRVMLERKRRKLSPKGLAKQAAVSVEALTRFEKTGKITLSNLLSLLRALDAIDIFENALKPPEFSSMDEFVAAIKK